MVRLEQWSFIFTDCTIVLLICGMNLPNSVLYLLVPNIGDFCELIRFFTTSHWLSFIYFSVSKRTPFECHIFSSPSLQGVYCSLVSGQDTILDEGHTGEGKGSLLLESATEPESYMSSSKEQLTLTSLHNQSSWLIPAQDSLTSLSTVPKKLSPRQKDDK